MLAALGDSCRISPLPLPAVLKSHICGSPSDILINKTTVPDNKSEPHRTLQYKALEGIHSTETNIEGLPSLFRSSEGTVREVIHSITASTPHYRYSISHSYFEQRLTSVRPELLTLLPQYSGLSEHTSKSIKSCSADKLVGEIITTTSKARFELEELRIPDSTSLVTLDRNAKAIRGTLNNMTQQNQHYISGALSKFQNTTQTITQLKSTLIEITTALYQDRVPLSVDHLDDHLYWRILLTPYYHAIHDFDHTAKMLAELFTHMDQAFAWSSKIERQLEMMEMDIDMLRVTLNGTPDSEVEAGLQLYIDDLKAGAEYFRRMKGASGIGSEVKGEL